jgi:hypothetical protein
MRAKKGYEQTCAIPIGEGVLILRELFLETNDYGPSPRVDSPLYEVVFEKSGKRAFVKTVSQIGRLIEGEGVCVSEVLEGYASDFAKIVGLMVIGKGRVITEASLFSFLEEKSDIQITKNLPRVENGDLKFLVCHLTLKPSLEVWRVSLSLSRFTVGVEKLIPAEDVPQALEAAS